MALAFKGSLPNSTPPSWTHLKRLFFEPRDTCRMPMAKPTSPLSFSRARARARFAFSRSAARPCLLCYGVAACEGQEYEPQGKEAARNLRFSPTHFPLATGTWSPSPWQASVRFRSWGADPKRHIPASQQGLPENIQLLGPHKNGSNRQNVEPGQIVSFSLEGSLPPCPTCVSQKTIRHIKSLG